MKAVNIQGSLYHACRSNDREFVRTLLFSRSDELDVLYDTPTPPVTIQLSPMYVACAGGHQKIVEMLLRHPSAKVRSNSQRYTRFLSMAAESGRSGVVRLLLKHCTLNHNEVSASGYTPLSIACLYGHPNVVKELIASGKDIDTGKPPDAGPVGCNNDAIFVTHMAYIHQQNQEEIDRNEECRRLVSEYEADKEVARYNTRKELGLLEPLVAEYLSLVVFVCEGLLKPIDKSKVKFQRTIQLGDNTFKTSTERYPGFRFLDIVTQLPLELQMIICNRAVGLSKDLVKGNLVTDASKDLAQHFLVKE